MTGRIINKKKGVVVLGIAAAVMLLAVIGLLLGHRITEQRYGLSLAPEVSHEMFVKNEDRVRLVIRPEFLLPYLDHYLSEEGETPTIGPSTTELFRQVLPREIALLARSDLPSDKIYLTLFANEKRGGPYIQTRINNANVLARIPGVNWDSEGLDLHERGSLVAGGTLALPASMKEAQQLYWPLHIQEQSATIKGGHLAELVVDNSNGDLLTLFAIVASFLGEDWRSVVGFLFMTPTLGHFGPPPSPAEFYEFPASTIIPTLHTVHVTLDIQQENAIIISLSLDVDNKNGPNLAVVFSTITFHCLGNWLKYNFSLVLDGSLRWDETQDLIVGSYTISGMQPILKDIICSAIALIEYNDVMFNAAYLVNTLFHH